MKTNRTARWIQKVSVALTVLVVAAIAVVVVQVSITLASRLPVLSAPSACQQQGSATDVSPADLLAVALR